MVEKLVNVFWSEELGLNCVDGRELYEALKANKDFTSYMKDQLRRVDAKEGVDYKAKYIDTRGHFKGEVAITSVEPPEEEKWAFKNTYIIALDTAKEICMVVGVAPRTNKETKEIWKDIQGYEGMYQVSSHGRVRSLDRVVERKGRGTLFVKGRVLTQSDDTHGYMKVNLTKHDQKRTFKVHRLVAIHFLDNPDNLPCVNHKDENKLNNNVNNLEWCTKAYNNSYGTKAKRQSETRKKLFREGKLKVWNKK